MTRAQLEKLFDQFLATFKGYSLDYDGAYGAQCFDLIQEWNRDWLSCPRWITGNYAYQIAKQLPEYYTWIENTPDAVPQKGDIIVWEQKFNGWAGHTAVATGKGDVWKFEAFSQNDPTGSPCILKTYNYSAVDGWLRWKTTNPTPIPSLTPQQMVDQIRTLGSLPADQYKTKVMQIVKG